MLRKACSSRDGIDSTHTLQPCQRLSVPPYNPTHNLPIPQPAAPLAAVPSRHETPICIDAQPTQIIPVMSQHADKMWPRLDQPRKGLGSVASPKQQTASMGPPLAQWKGWLLRPRFTNRGHNAGFTSLAYAGRPAAVILQTGDEICQLGLFFGRVKRGSLTFFPSTR